MLFLRSLLLNVCSFLWLLFWCLFFLPISIFPFGVRWCQRVVSFGYLLFLRIFIGARFQFRGYEKLPKDKSIILVCKHQSSLETIVLPSYFDRPAFIIKRSLLFLPLIGIWFLLSDQIAINRNDGRNAIKKIVSKAKNILKQNRILILFPEGTRVAPGQEGNYKAGIYTIANSFSEVEVYLLALNTGLACPRNSFFKYRYDIVIEVIDKLDNVKNYKKSEYMQMIKSKIETKVRELEQEAIKDKNDYKIV